MELYHIFLILIGIVIILLFINVIRYKILQKREIAKRIMMQENRRRYYGKDDDKS